MTSPATTPARLRPIDIGKPRMRGWLHTYAFFTSIAAGVALCATAAATRGADAVVSCVIYSLTVCGLFGISALYHRRVWTPNGFKVMRRLDHSMIFMFIAGTYTPFCAFLLPPTKRAVILAVVWGGGLLGVGMKMITPHAPRWASTPLYVALGWVAVAVVPDVLHKGGVAVLVLMFVGGAFYTAGAVLYALRRPNPWPKTFGHHEFFHACTLLAAISHQIAIYLALFS